MDVYQVGLIRKHVLRYVGTLRVYISTLPVKETEALARLSGDPGIETAVKICDCLLRELGHNAPAHYDRSPTFAAARKVIPKLRAG